MAEQRGGGARTGERWAGVREERPEDGEPTKRVALVTEFYYPHLGGMCEHVHFLAAELPRHGWAADIITGRMRGTARPPGTGPAPRVVRLGRSLSVYANGSHARVTVGRRLRADVRRVLREGRYDVVHVHSPLTPTLPLLAIDEAESPVVGTFHTQLGERVRAYEVGRRYFQRRMDRLAAAIAVSPTAARSYARYFRAEWTVVPNGIDAALFRPDAPPPPHVGGGVPTLLFLGRLDPRNGLGTLLRAYERLRSWGGRAGRARLVVVGGGPLERLYRFKAARLPDVHFVGKVLAQRPGYYAHSDVYVCPSKLASFGITVLESMACGTPVVCSEAEGFRHVMTDGQEGLVTPIDDPDALARALQTLLEDDTLRARMGRAGRRRALEFAWPRIAGRIVDVYEGVLGEGRAARPGAAA